MRSRITIIAMIVAAGCGSNQNNKKPETDAAVTPDAGADAETMMLASRCIDTPTAWSAGTAAFRNTTDGANLTAIDAEGIRIAAADIDGDGDADLAIRSGGAKGDDFDGDVRSNWLLRNNGDGTFEDVTQESGVVRTRFAADPTLGRPAEVWAFADVDNDGDVDVFTGFSNPDGTNPEGSEIMLNDGSGNFEFGPLQTPFHFRGELASVSGASWTDFDRDGHVDLWLGRGTVERRAVPDLLFRQTAPGEFEDVTESLGLMTSDWLLGPLNSGEAHTNAWASAACDLDGDGNPELLASSYGRTPNKLWHAVRDEGSVQYENHSIESGYAFDEDTDWTDNEQARCWCTLHPDAEDCAGVPEPELIPCANDDDAWRWNHANDREIWRLGGNSGSTICGDVDNDGDIDLLTTEIVHRDVGSNADPSELLFNDGASPPSFDRPGNEQTGLTRTHDNVMWDDGDITGALFDFDNDGRLDVLIGSTDYPGTRAHLYHQTEDGTFEKVSEADGIDLTSAHGVAVADYDLDGDLDVVMGHSRFRCQYGDHCLESAHARFFENEVGNQQNWVRIELEGTDGTNRAAIGARLTADTSAGLQTREVGGGHGHYGIQNELPVHFGLGPDCETVVTVRWPNADLEEQTFTLQAGYSYRLIQGEEPVPLNLDETDGK